MHSEINVLGNLNIPTHHRFHSLPPQIRLCQCFTFLSLLYTTANSLIPPRPSTPLLIYTTFACKFTLFLNHAITLNLCTSHRSPNSYVTATKRERFYHLAFQSSPSTMHGHALFFLAFCSPPTTHTTLPSHVTLINMRIPHLTFTKICT